MRNLAAAELERRRRRRKYLLGLPLLDFVPGLSPRLDRPDHLSPIADAIERTETEEVYLLVSTAPQHGKTELVAHAIARFIARHPERQVIYVSFSARRAAKISKDIRRYSIATGVVLSGDSKAAGQWRTREGGGLLACGIFGGITGEPGALVVIDDPHKNRKEADSPVYRQRVIDEVRSSILTRIHPGTSVIVVHTRWHADDLIGTLERDPILKDDNGEPLIGSHGRPIQWEIVNLPAINDNGEALWPARRSLDWLKAQKARIKSEYDWWSLYMGRPRPRGAAVFGPARFYDGGPPQGYSLAIGVDLAYSKKTSADYSVAVVLARLGAKYFVLDIVRRQVKAPEFVEELKELRKRFPGAAWRAYLAGTELGVADLMRSLGADVGAVGVTQDKFLRAQPVAATWNDADAETGVLLPSKAPWLESFLSEVRTFTGVSDAHDDQVDALAAAYDKLHRAPVTSGGIVVAPIPMDERPIGELPF